MTNCLFRITHNLQEDTQKDNESLLQHSYEYSESSPLRDTVLAVSHESFDYEVPDSETAHWEPASVEDEVRAQLLDSGVLHIAGSSIRYVDLKHMKHNV